MFKCGDKITNIAPIRVGMGYGPERNGIAPIGEEFEVISVDYSEPPTEMLIKCANGATTYKHDDQFKLFRLVGKGS